MACYFHIPHHPFQSLPVAIPVSVSPHHLQPLPVPLPIVSPHHIPCPPFQIIKTPPNDRSFLPSEDDIFPHSLDRAFKFTVIGRLVLGDDQQEASDIYDLCDNFHFHSSTWRLIFLGDGHYLMQFTSSSDYFKISSMTCLPSKYGTLHLIPERSPEFNALRKRASRTTHNCVTVVRWRPPPPSWIKVNTDGSARGCPGPSSSGCVFRDSTGAVLGCFSMQLEEGYALEAQLSACVSAVMIARDRGWKKLWLESDSTKVVELLASRSCAKVPGRMKNVWKQVLSYLSSGEIEFRVSHIYREGNRVADALASPEAEKGWWPYATPAVAELVHEDAIGRVNIRSRS